MIGEKIKIGFDGSAVKRGLGNIMGGFGKLRRGIGGGIRQVGVGMARQAGASLFGTIMRGVQAIPNQIKDISNLRQEFFALGDATGASVEGLLALRQAISKTSNVSADLAGKSLKEMVAKLGEAQAWGTPGQQALSQMGINRQEIKGKDPIEQMRMLAEGYQRVRKSAAGIEGANDIIRDLMGSRIGKDLTPLLLNFESSMARGAKETAQTAKYINEMADDLDGFDDIGRAFDILFMNSSMGFLEVLKKAGINMREIATMVEGLDFTKQFSGVGDFLKKEYAEFNKYLDANDLGGYLMNKLKALGQWITDMIATGIEKGLDLAMNNPKIKGLLDSFNVMGKGSDLVDSAVDKVKGLWGGKTTSNSFNSLKSSGVGKMLDNTKIEDNTSRTNELLQNIAEGGTIGRFA